MISSELKEQRAYFSTGATRDIEWRQGMLKKLAEAIHAREEKIMAALKADLGKPSVESYLSEVLFMYEEIKHATKKLPSWAKPQRTHTPVAQFPARSELHFEPLGVVLIIGPWNYPFQLVMAPLIGAIAAGNCAVLKPSELAPHTSKVIAELIKETFDPRFVHVVEGGVEASQALLKERFDHIFFTGGATVGRVVLEAAAKYLTPVTLELGGKSPCLIDNTVDLDLAARRISWGKFFNAGQTCVAPDYVLAPKDLVKPLVASLREAVRKSFGEEPKKSQDFGRIINRRHFDRLLSYVDPKKVVIGGESDPESLFIAPTVMADCTADDASMREEIFGPILPILPYERFEEAVAFVNSRPKPLACYLFSGSREVQERVVRDISFGGGCINDTLIHLAIPGLPFGGVGESGIGAYHGKYGFETFSHRKSVVNRALWLDLPLRYPPYTEKKLPMLKRILE